MAVPSTDRRADGPPHMRRRATWLTAVLLGGMWLAVSATAAETPVYRARGLDASTVDFVLGNFEFVLLHELAHVVIGELKASCWL